MRVGLFGGTFDPIHIGHLIAAEEARESAGLDRVVFVPCGIPPHKRSELVSAGPVRLEMTRLATRGNPGFEVSEFEVSRDEASFTIETVRHFSGKLGRDAELFLIVGADSVLEMSACPCSRLLICPRSSRPRTGRSSEPWT